MKQRRRWRAAATGVTTLVVAVTCLNAGRSSAHAPGVAEQPDAVIQRDCHELPGAPRGDLAEARDLVPGSYDVDPDDDGQAELLVNIRHCESLTVGDVTTSDAIDSYIAIAIERPDPPAPHPSFVQPGEHDDASDDPGLARLEFYIVQWITNSSAHAKWLKQAGLGNKVKIVDDLRYDYDPAPGNVPGAIDDGFVFRAPAPAPSPFHVDATVTEPGPEPWDTGINLWADTDEGTAIIYGEQLADTDAHFGPATGTITSDDPDSPMGRIFGEDQTRPIRDEPTTSFASASFSAGQWTKCIRTSMNLCDQANH